MFAVVVVVCFGSIDVAFALPDDLFLIMNLGTGAASCVCVCVCVCV